MNIVLGASGQVGSAVVDSLVQQKAAVTGVVRNAKHAEELTEKGVSVAIADAFDLPALQSAFVEGKTVFLLTPETPVHITIHGSAITITPVNLGIPEEELDDTIARLRPRYKTMLENLAK